MGPMREYRQTNGAQRPSPLPVPAHWPHQYFSSCGSRQPIQRTKEGPKSTPLALIQPDHESRRIVVRQVGSHFPMLVSAFEAPSLVESQAALQADYSDAPREGSLSSVSSVVPDSEVDPHRHHMHEPPSSRAERPRPTTGSLSRACRPRRLHVPRDRQGLQRFQLRRRAWDPTGV